MPTNRNVPTLRLSDKERMIVSYISRQLSMVYRNTSGKPVYARSMDQVMKDIFGIKKFCKTLERAMRNESIMIDLMKTLDTVTLWKVCMSREHYRLLCTLVAMDHQIVKMGKKLNAMAEMEPGTRPTAKMRKLMKDIKKSKKMYKSCIKTFQDIFDIEPINKSGNSMYDYLSEWLNKNDRDSDFFYDFDSYSFSDSTIQSMDEYVNAHSRKKSSSRNNGGALGIFDSSSQFLYGDDEYPDENDEDMELLETLKNYFGDDGRPSPRKKSRSSDSDVEDLRSDITDMASIINEGFTRIADSLDGLYSIMTEESEDVSYGTEVSAPSHNSKYDNIADMIAATEAHNQQSNIVDVTPTDGEAPSNG